MPFFLTMMIGHAFTYNAIVFGLSAMMNVLNGMIGEPTAPVY